MTRAYLRLDPAFFERKAIDQGYPAEAIVALVGVFCLAESQPQRGYFRNERLLRALLARYGRQVPFLMEHRDVIATPDGRLYAEGWNEWQEGDWKVGERVRRIRSRKRVTGNGPHRSDVTPATVTDVTNGPVYTPSEHSVIDGAGSSHEGGTSHEGAGQSGENDESTESLATVLRATAARDLVDEGSRG